MGIIEFREGTRNMRKIGYTLEDPTKRELEGALEK